MKDNAENNLKNRLYKIIFEADTPAGRFFDVALFISILLSVAVTMLHSVQEIATAWGGVLVALNWMFTGLFSVEYLLRLYCAEKPVRYARSFFGMVDLLAILPTYLSFFFPHTRFLAVIRILRMLRIFRVLKMVQYVGAADLLMNALVSSRRKIGIFMFTVLTLVVILGSLMYVIEGAENGFTSIPKGVYWAIVTMTTVGYGDISPQTGLGQTLAAFVMILGYSIIAVPTGIISAELTAASGVTRKSKGCATCGRNQHAADAQFCAGCGRPLISLGG